MKTIFFMLLCAFFMLTNSSYATDIGFNVQIWKNTVSPASYLGSFTGSTNSDDEYVISANHLGSICPGDELIIRNLIAKDGSAHNFTGLSTFGKATIALSNSVGHNVPLSIFGQVCTLSCAPVPTVPNWNWGSTVTFTVPPYASTNPYLTIMTGTGNSTPPNNCGPRWIHIPMNLGSTTTIDDQTICSGDIVNLSLDPNFTYSNWSNPNPDGTALGSTQNYTVDITHMTTGCTRTVAFKIEVSNPDIDLFASDESLCFSDAGFTLTENWFWGLAGSNNYPMKLVIDGVVVADEDASPDIMNFPHIINGSTYGSGPVTVEYTYQDFDLGIICTKIYTVTIHPEITTVVEDNYAVCDNNFTEICAHLPGTLLIGATYQWTKIGDFFIHSTDPCYTPSSYGDYCLKITDAFGCRLTKCFTVYNPGVGIYTPSDIIFCSLTQSPPSYIGWSSDPFGLIRYSFVWTYTDEDGVTVPVSNTGAQYQVPYLGAGTYTVVVNANGCTETFTITVTDLLHIYENHANAAFSFNPLSGNNVACIPTVTMSGMTEEWIVTDQYGAPVTTIPYGTGIRFSYTTGVNYVVKFRRISGGQWCQVFTNQFTWSDNSIRTGGNGGSNNRNNRINVSNTGITASAPAEVQAFPNPTTGLVHLKLHNFTSTQTTVQVINTLGAIVLEKEVQEISTLELDLSKQSSGIYMIRVINGTDELTQKIIKE